VAERSVVVRAARVRFSASAYPKRISSSDVYLLILRSLRLRITARKIIVSVETTSSSNFVGQPATKNFISSFVSYLWTRVDRLAKGRFLTKEFFGGVRW
jgi:hypothetical protein